MYWDPANPYQWKHPRPPRPDRVKIYEAHVGMATNELRKGTYLEFAHVVLPQVKELGYNWYAIAGIFLVVNFNNFSVQLMAVMHHAYYACFGYQPTSFFAPSAHSGMNCCL